MSFESPHEDNGLAADLTPDDGVINLDNVPSIDDIAEGGVTGVREGMIKNVVTESRELSPAEAAEVAKTAEIIETIKVDPDTGGLAADVTPEK